MDLVVNFENVSKSFTRSVGGPRDVKHHLIKFFRRNMFKETLDSSVVLDNVSFQIRPGEFVGIMGKNGVGKSTLLKIISGIYRPNQGKVSVFGRTAPVLELGAGFADELNGYENIFLNASILGYSRKQANETAEAIVEFSELKEHINYPVRNYSSGMLVRLAFSIACHLDADLLLFDEVLAVGDLGFQAKCLKKIQELNAKGASIILVSHSPEQIAAHCSRCLVIDAGHLIYDGPADIGSQKYIGLFA
jgi:ABC-type polysaccharide/polyol phosphate transport system ATPase subunit